MNINLQTNERNNIIKYKDYAIEIINNNKYIKAKNHTENKNSTLDLYYYYKELPLIDLINIGKASIEKKEDLEIQIINFVNTYGPLGLINDLPINKYYILDEKIILKNDLFFSEENIGITYNINKLDYFKIFFPNLNDTKLKELIENTIYTLCIPCNEQTKTSCMNEDIICNIEYSEPVSMFIKYAEQMYLLLSNLLGENKNDTENTYFINNLNANHITLYLIIGEMQNTMSFSVSSLKQYIDFHFAKIVSQEPNLLKFCKHCGKAFVSKNPKAEYDTPQCKNQANVYKSRAKNK